MYVLGNLMCMSVCDSALKGLMYLSLGLNTKCETPGKRSPTLTTTLKALYTFN